MLKAFPSHGLAGKRQMLPSAMRIRGVAQGTPATPKQRGNIIRAHSTA